MNHHYKSLFNYTFCFLILYCSSIFASSDLDEVEFVGLGASQGKRTHVTFHQGDGLAFTLGRGEDMTLSTYDTSTVNQMLTALDSGMYSNLSWASVLGYAIKIAMRQRKSTNVIKFSFSKELGFFSFPSIQGVTFTLQPIERGKTIQVGKDKTIITRIVFKQINAESSSTPLQLIFEFQEGAGDSYTLQAVLVMQGDTLIDGFQTIAAIKFREKITEQLHNPGKKNTRWGGGGASGGAAVYLLDRFDQELPYLNEETMKLKKFIVDDLFQPYL